MRRGIKESAPHTTVKQLLWLDGKDSRNVNTTPAQRPASAASSPSPSTHPSNRKSPVPDAPKSTVLAKPRMPSQIDSSPSPAVRHQLSQARRAYKVSPPLLRRPPSHRPSVSHEQQKRLSIIQHQNNDTEADNLRNVRPRFDSLAPVPDLLEWTDTSDSMFPGGVASSTSPEVVSRVHMSPSQPAPNRTAFERVGERRIGDAIEGLEDMVQETIGIADETADRRQLDNMYDIIEEARAAIQEVSVDPTPKSSVLVGNVRLEIPDIPTGPHRELTSFDWAYPENHRRQDSSSSTPSSSDLEDQRHARFGTQSDLLLPPQPIQANSREHVDFVLRPIARDQSRGRSRHRFNGDSAAPVRRQRYRHSSTTTSNSRSGRRQHMTSSFSQNESSFEEEHLSTNPYGNALSRRPIIPLVFEGVTVGNRLQETGARARSV
jgi:hypothetical protein